ncbi:transcription/translation regulatory transformer protein RfaH [Herbaspirillum sp.]|uniref:transcription/translation regulatory transformer protein RfaH n=1 Tax=Herbaspirillum sp. TaxID=1890675 RepID=UPI001B2CC44D|nr:transcription/translation regulatory transformer protein RfaH [Herbaspirillum sp.]MBO9536979.1 transcription/translation regulatory transformer protein RfaH [Herbaspirillum sp.]
MHWYLVHTKPKQEKCALQNLEQQGYQCYLPMLREEKVRHENICIVENPLFPRYLFVRLGLGPTAKSWQPIRSTKGVSRLVTFGTEPARIDDGLIEGLRAQESAHNTHPLSLFAQGQSVRLTRGAFAGIEGIYQMADGERRAMVLIEFLSKPIRVSIPVGHLVRVI